MSTEPDSKSMILHSLEDLISIVDEVFQFAAGRRKFALMGDLGAGKTTFTQFFCKKLGVNERVTSPTFALVNEYTFLQGNGKEGLFHHLDMYRLKDLQEALDIGIEDYLYDGHYCFIEWPEIIEPLLPPDTVRIKISILPDSTRKIILL